MRIRLEGVGKSFATPDGVHVALRDVTLDIPEGRIQGVIGRSGAGKSTLLRLLNGLETPDAGRVLVAGQDVAGLDAAGLRALRRRVGMVFQHFNLIAAKTVAQNVALPLVVAGVPRPEISDRLAEVLHRVGLEGREEAYPAQLSGGQKQRVGIARALISRPEVVLCDEATSALDPETSLAILDLLRDINAELGVTMLLITHEMAVVRRICDRVAVMEAGKIVEEGPVWQLFAAPGTEASRALLAPLQPALPAEVAARLRPQPFAGALRVVRLRFVGDRPPLVPQGIWLAGEMRRIAGHPVGAVILALPADSAAIAGMEDLGYVAADD